MSATKIDTDSDAKIVRTHLPRPLSTASGSYIDIVPFQELDRLFSPPSERKLERALVLVTGAPGSGKSTLAVQYGRHFATTNSEAVVIFFNADDEAKTDERVRAILADDLGLSDDELRALNRADRVARVLESVAASGQRKHLFIFDHVDEEQTETVALFSRHRPANLKILLTSRSPRVAKLLGSTDAVEQLRMSCLNNVQIKQFIVDRLGGQLARSTLEKVYEELFIKHFSRGETTPFVLRTVLETLSLHHESKGLEEHELDAVIDELKSLDALEFVLKSAAKVAGARELLELASFLDSDAVSLEALSLLADGPVDPAAVEALEKRSLFEPFILDEQKYERVPRPTAQAVQERLRQEPKRHELESLRLAVRLGEVLGDESRSKVDAVYLHALRFLRDKEISNVEELELQERTIVVAKELKQDLVSAIRGRKRLLRYHQEAGRDQLAVVKCLNNLGLAHRDAGDLDNAVKYLTEAHDLVVKVHRDQPDNAMIAASLNNLGAALRDRGDPAALGHFAEAVEVLGKISGEEELRLACLSNLGAACLAAGDARSAVKWLVEADELARVVHSTQHPARALGLTSLAAAYRETGDLKSALTCFQEAHEVVKVVFEGQTAVAQSLGRLGMVHRELGDHRSAIKCLNEAYELTKAVHRTRPHHPDVVASLNELGSLYRDIGENHHAIKYLNEAAKLLKLAYADQHCHPAVAFNRDQLGMAYQNMGDSESAIKYLCEANEIMKVVYKNEPASLPLALNMNNLGAAYLDRGDDQKAIKLLTGAYKIMRTVFRDGSASAAFASCLNNLGLAYLVAGDSQKAIKYLSRASEATRAVYGEQPGHPLLLFNLTYLGLAHRDAGDEESATRCLEEVRRNSDPSQVNHADLALIFDDLELDLNEASDE